MKLYRIKEGYLPQFLEWGRYLESNSEALETLLEEEVRFEAFYYFQIGEEYFTFGVTDNPFPLPATDRELNRRHREILRDCLEPITQVNQVYILKILSK